MALRPRSPGARRLHEAVLALRSPMRVERSIKLVPGALLAERFLLGVPKRALGADPAAALASLGRRIGWPPLAAALVAEHLDAADHVHLGWEEGEGRATAKLYLETAAEARRARAAGRPATVHRAVKLDPERPEAARTSRYDLAEGAAVAVLAGLFADRPEAPGLALGRDALALAPEGMLLVVSEAGSPRRSFDLNLYGGEYPVSALAGPLMRTAAALGIGAEEAADRLGSVGSRPLGHVSGGLDRHGRAFATLYYGAD
jgi:hypothetical protein